MVQIKHSQRRVLESALDMSSGYVLNFSDRTFAEFFEDLGITIYQERYSFNGSSKAKHLRAFLEVEDEGIVSRALRELWAYRKTIPHYHDASDDLEKPFFELVEMLESGATTPSTEAIDRFNQDQTLDELVASIERDVRADRPAVAMDRLHTYCMKKFGHLLSVRGVSWTASEPLQSRVGKYVRSLKEVRELRDVTEQIMKNAIGVFEKFNYVRNNQSLAHDNQLLDPAEARFIYDSVCAILKFVRAIESSKFDASGARQVAHAKE